VWLQYHIITRIFFKLTILHGIESGTCVPLEMNLLPDRRLPWWIFCRRCFRILQDHSGVGCCHCYI